MIIASAALCIIALTWAGVQYPWSSVQVVAPLVIGLAGLPAALLYDMYYASHPVVRELGSCAAMLGPAEFVDRSQSQLSTTGPVSQGARLP